MWFGLAWYGLVCLVWYGWVWYGLVWLGTVWYGTVWFGLVCLVWFGMFGFVRFGMVWYGLVWYVLSLLGQFLLKRPTIPSDGAPQAHQIVGEGASPLALPELNEGRPPLRALKSDPV